MPTLSNLLKHGLDSEGKKTLRQLAYGVFQNISHSDLDSWESLFAVLSFILGSWCLNILPGYASRYGVRGA
jgi:hypothetical protein